MLLMQPLWKSISFLWQYRKKNFAAALALRLPGEAVSSRELWAMHRLGMHFSVAAAPSESLDWRGNFAKTVGYAACGQAEAACDALKMSLRICNREKGRLELAKALAPFLPDQALQLADGCANSAPAFLVALLLRNGESARARDLLDSVSTQAHKKFPELHLLRTTARDGTPVEQLQHLNSFMGAHGLQPLQLRDVSRPPSPINVDVAHPPSEVQGPLVTVLMTTFRTGPRAAIAVRSVLEQSYRNLELIVVDDASGDDTATQVQELAERDARVRVLRLCRNVGTYAAKLIGMSLARGEFVTCHDSDDWSHPEKIARQVAPLVSDSRLVCTVSSFVRMQDDGQFYSRPVYPLMRMNPSSLLFRRERVVREAGAWDCVRTGADSEFLGRLRVVFGARAIKKIGLPLALGSHRLDSLMTAETTGHSAAAMSPQRLAYWEAWSHWHIDALARGQRPFIPVDVRAALTCRPFAVPDALQVPAADVEACWQAVFGQATRNGDAQTRLPLGP